MAIPQLPLPLSLPPDRRHPAEVVREEDFGFDHWRTGQIEAIRPWMDGRDTTVLLPTGGGKSACFQIPAVHRWRQGLGLTVVVSPLIALMDDQIRSLVKKSIPAVALHSAQDTATRAASLRDAPHAALVYVSPERLATSRFRRWLTRQNVSGVVVDEAHCISEWGHDFRPKYTQLGEIRDLVEAPMMATTATATRRVMGEVVSLLRLREPAQVIGDIRRTNLRFSVEHIQGDKARTARVVSLLKSAPAGRVVIYAATRKRARTVSDRLRRLGLPSTYYHAGRTAGARDTAYRAFVEGRRPILVATSAFGMGIDQPNVRLVVHVQAPGTLEAYYQEAGRAGRDGEDAECVLLYAHSDAVTQARLRGNNPPPGVEVGWKGLQDYAFGRSCRQSTFNNYFLEVPGEPCGRCDACVRPSEVARGVGEARAVSTQRREKRRAKAHRESLITLEPRQVEEVIRFVGALKRPVGKRLVALGLRGSNSKPVRRKGLRNNPAYGSLRGVPESTIVRCVEQLLEEGRLAPRGKKYPTVWIPNKRVRTPSKRPSAAPASDLKRALQNFRKREARRKGWKTYQVFNNATLDGIVLARPQSLTDLQSVPGMGPRRLDRWGTPLLELVRLHPPP